jgi:cyclopropane-fatty-acyl-phospholipid synthase
MTTTPAVNRGASAAAIQHHYDVGNDFYKVWLDSSRTYSAALWEGDDDLEAAQLRKIDFHIAQARAPGVDRVLDVGCGWGALLQRLVDVHGVQQAVGLTLSRAQAEWVAALGHPRIEVRVEGWLEHVPTAPYDAIISIGAFEHFVKPDLSDVQKQESYRTFFRRCHGWLKPGGWLSLQTIAYGNISARDTSRFIVTDVFPESDLPTLADVVLASDGLFEIVALRNDRQDYARTNRAWLARFKAHRADLVALAGEEVVARYQHSLSLFLIGFHTGTMHLLRLTLRRNDTPWRW